MKIIKNMIKCKRCGDIIESKSVHDYKSCSCGLVSIDGGCAYIRRCGDPEDWEELSVMLEDENVPKNKHLEQI
jgi:hypothetical protein